MKELFERARRENLWFWSPYQDLWFSPEELEVFQREGRFRWGPVNWQLRDPREKLREIEAKITSLQNQHDSLRNKISGKSS